MKKQTTSTERFNQRGMALIAVLWVVAFLSMLLVITLTVLKVDVDDAVSDVHSHQAWLLAHEGLSYGVHPKVDRDDPVLIGADTGFDEAYAVIIESEGKRYNINYILKSKDKNLLLAIFQDWGLEDSDADQLVDALLDWVDGDDLVSLNGAEDEYYRDLGYEDRPYNRPFRDLDEVPLVRGFDLLERLQPNWREYFTLWSEGQIDVHEAPPEVLTVAADIDYTAAETYHNLVLGEDGLMGTEDDIRFSSLDQALNEMDSPPAQREEISKRFRLSGGVLRVVSDGRSGRFRYRITAVIGSKSGQTNILDYKEKRLTSE